MSIALKTALYRLLRALAAAGISIVIEWAINSLTAFNLPAAYTPFAMALLLAIDKWWRERKNWN